MILFLMYLPFLVALGWILGAELRDRRRDRQQDEAFLPPPSWELRVQEAADTLWAARMVGSWEHGYAITVLVAEVFELEETAR